LVNLNNYLNNVNYLSPDADTQAKEFIYELMYVRDNKIFPLNSLLINGKAYNLNCDKLDYTLNPYVAFDFNYGTYVIGYIGDLRTNLEKINEILDKYAFDTLYTARLDYKTVDDNKILLATNMSKCTTTCNGVSIKSFHLKSDAILARVPQISIDKLNYPAKLKSLEDGEVTIKITNNSDFQIPSIKYGRLYIKELSSAEIPELYVKSWDSLHIPVVINQKAIPPHSSVELTFKVGPYVYPKTYSGNFGIFWDGKYIKDSKFNIKVSVYKGDLQLGYIVGRELDYVNVRSKPDLRAPIAFKLDVGEYVIVNKVDGAWVNITSQYGDTGWVYKPLIRIE